MKWFRLIVFGSIWTYWWLALAYHQHRGADFFGSGWPERDSMPWLNPGELGSWVGMYAVHALGWSAYALPGLCALGLCLRLSFVKIGVQVLGPGLFLLNEIVHQLGVEIEEAGYEFPGGGFLGRAGHELLVIGFGSAAALLVSLLCLIWFVWLSYRAVGLWAQPGSETHRA